MALCHFCGENEKWRWIEINTLLQQHAATILHYEDNKAIQEMSHLVQCLVSNTENIAMHVHMMNFSKTIKNVYRFY